MTYFELRFQGTTIASFRDLLDATDMARVIGAGSSVWRSDGKLLLRRESDAGYRRALADVQNCDKLPAVPVRRPDWRAA